MIVLYDYGNSVCCQKVRITLREKGLEWEARRVDLFTSEQYSAAYMKLNPKGVVPTLVHDGVPIIESTLINEYLNEVFPSPALLPADPVGRAQARFWVKFEDDVLHPVIRPASFQLLMAPLLAKLSDGELDALVARHPNKARGEQFRAAARGGFDAAAVTSAKTAMSAALDKLEKRLVEAPFLGGLAYSLADVAAAPFIDRLEEMQMAGLWANRPVVAAWIARVKARPAYRTAIPRTNQRFQLAPAAGCGRGV